MSVLRTPDQRFANLPGYPFPPNYLAVQAKGAGALRMHYVDVGPADGPVVVLVHGQPTWSFLYRNVIHVLHDAGLRVIAPDHIGFGRSLPPTPTAIRQPGVGTPFFESGSPAPVARTTPP